MSDTSPIISPIKAGQLTLLKRMYGEVVVPHAVFDELVQNNAFANEADEVRRCGFITRKAVLNREAVLDMQTQAGLDFGEAEAIVLAIELDADLLLIDDAPGRRAAQAARLDRTGTIGMLSVALKANLLTGQDLKSCVAALREANRYYKESLLQRLLDEADAAIREEGRARAENA